MANPYEVLGVNENATDEQIKAAYKELVKKYHPDKYANNPLSDLASEKMKEINEAYDALIKNKGSRNGYSSGNTGRSRDSFGDFNTVRQYINAGNIMAAENLVNSISVRNAEWHYLMGLVYSRKGWYDKAYQHISRAAMLDPTNMEYKNAFNSMNNQSNSYRTAGNMRGYNNAGCSSCDCCTSLICADCCCECAGGDLISCC